MFSGKPVKGIVHTKMKFESSFTHIGVVLKPYGLLSFMDHKRRIKKKKSDQMRHVLYIPSVLEVYNMV